MTPVLSLDAIFFQLDFYYYAIKLENQNITLVHRLTIMSRGVSKNTKAWARVTGGPPTFTKG